MATPSLSQAARLEAQEQRIADMASRMDKYDKIIADLHTIVVALKTRADTNQKWIATMLVIGATLVGSVLGALSTYVLGHLH